MSRYWQMYLAGVGAIFVGLCIQGRYDTAFVTAGIMIAAAAGISYIMSEGS